MSNPSDSQAPIVWRVVSQREGPGRTDAGAFVPGITITYTWGAGNVGEVFIPRALATPDAIRAAIVARLDTHKLIAGLSGTV